MPLYDASSLLHCYIPNHIVVCHNIPHIQMSEIYLLFEIIFKYFSWYQQVSSRPGRTLAVTLKFSHLWWFNKRDCDDTDRDSPSKPLSHFSILKDFGELRLVLTNKIGPLNLTHCSQETCKRVIGKQCRSRSDAAECSV